MSEFMFCLGPGHLPAAARRIARKHDAVLVNYTEPNGTRRHWFTADNLGEPFDSGRAKVVKADLVAAGLIADK